MAGVKGKSGGARKGAGRKPRERKQFVTPKKIEHIEEVYDDMPKCDMGIPQFPKELEEIPYAKQAWDYAVSCDRQSSIHLLNERHYEALKSYCIAVAQRRLLIDEWINYKRPIQYEDDRGNIKIHPLMKEIDNKNKQVNEYAEALGLTVLGEYKLAKTVKSAPTLTGDGESEGEGDLF